MQYNAEGILLFRSRFLYRDLAYLNTIQSLVMKSLRKLIILASRNGCHCSSKRSFSARKQLLHSKQRWVRITTNLKTFYYLQRMSSKSIFVLHLPLQSLQNRLIKKTNKLKAATQWWITKSHKSKMSHRIPMPVKLKVRVTINLFSHLHF